MEIKEDGIVFNIENKITIPNEIYKNLLINDYKYNQMINLFKIHSELNYHKDGLDMDSEFSDKFRDLFKVNENLIYESQLEKLKIEEENKKENE